MADDSVSVKFGAETSGFTQGVEQVKDKLGEVGDQAPNLAEKFVELGKVLVEAFAVEKIIEFTTRMADFGEQLERVSKMTGLTTDQVQQFQFAVKMTGGDAETAGISLTRFERNISEAASGTGTAAKAFQALGISLAELKSGNVAQIMGDIADKFSTTEDGANKTAIAIALFGRAGANLIPLLDQGRLGLAGMNDRLDDLHARQSPQAVASLAELAKATKQIDTAWQSFGADVVSIFAPGLTKLEEGTASLIAKLHEAFDWVMKLDGAWKHWVETGSLAKVLGEGAYRSGGVDQYGGSWSTDKPTTVDQATFLGGADQGLPQLPSLSGNSSADSRKSELSDIQAEMTLAKEQLALQVALWQQETVAHGITKQQEIAQQQQATEAEFVIDQHALQEKLALYAVGTADYTKTLNQMDILAAQHAVKMAQLDTKMAQANQQSAKQTYDSWKSALQPIETAFDGMLNGVLNGTETLSQAMASAFANMATSVVESILKIIAEWLLFEAVTGGQGTWNDFVAIQTGGGGGSGGPLGSIGKILSFDVGTSYVPQTGPAMLHQGEIVIPPAQSQSIREGGGFGGGPNVTINLSAIDTRSGVAFIKQNADAILKVFSTGVRNQSGSLNNMMKAN